MERDSPDLDDTVDALLATLAEQRASVEQNPHATIEPRRPSGADSGGRRAVEMLGEVGAVADGPDGRLRIGRTLSSSSSASKAWSGRRSWAMRSLGAPVRSVRRVPLRVSAGPARLGRQRAGPGRLAAGGGAHGGARARPGRAEGRRAPARRARRPAARPGAGGGASQAGGRSTKPPRGSMAGIAGPARLARWLDIEVEPPPMGATWRAHAPSGAPPA